MRTAAPTKKLLMIIINNMVLARDVQGIKFIERFKRQTNYLFLRVYTMLMVLSFALNQL